MKCTFLIPLYLQFVTIFITMPVLWDKGRQHLHSFDFFYPDFWETGSKLKEQPTGPSSRLLCH